MINVAVVGCGYWGPNLIRNFHENPKTRLAAICDLVPERLAKFTARYPGVKALTDYQQVLSDPEVHAVAIATPVSTHFKLALAALQHGKHVLVEKPITASSAEARTLIDEAAKRRLVLMVDHTFIYTGAIRQIRGLLDGGELGEVYYYDSTRVNLGLFQKDVSVIWDLAVHDLSIIDFLLRKSPVAVSATGVSHLGRYPENTAYLTLFFSENLIAHVNVNWLAPVKVRQTLIGGQKKMLIYNELEPSEKIKIYDRGLNTTPDGDALYQTLVGYRMGDVWSPQVQLTEALGFEVGHFADCIAGGRTPDSDGRVGLRVVRILEAAQRSIEARGAPQDIVSHPE